MLFTGVLRACAPACSFECACGVLRGASLRGCWIKDEGALILARCFAASESLSTCLEFLECVQSQTQACSVMRVADGCVCLSVACASLSCNSITVQGADALVNQLRDNENGQLMITCVTVAACCCVWLHVRCSTRARHCVEADYWTTPCQKLRRKRCLKSVTRAFASRCNSQVRHTYLYVTFFAKFLYPTPKHDSVVVLVSASSAIRNTTPKKSLMCRNISMLHIHQRRAHDSG